MRHLGIGRPICPARIAVGQVANLPEISETLGGVAGWQPAPRAATRGLYRRSGAIWIVVLCAAVAVQTAWGKAAAAEEDPYPPVKVVLHPAAEPKPALKYRLFPDILDRKPGNAAVVYGKVTAEQYGVFGDKEFWEKIPKAMSTPLAELRKDKDVRRIVGYGKGGIFDYLDRAARCQYCDWQLPVGEAGQDFWSILLPEVQQMRTFARLLAVRARLQIADRQYDQAVRTLQTGYALSKHAGEAPTIVQGLIGIACSSYMSDQVREFIQQPDAPNLYWALTNMPRPLINMRPNFEAEMQAVYLSYPDLRDLEHKDYSPHEWQQLMEKTIDRFYRLYQDEGGSESGAPRSVSAWDPGLDATGLSGGQAVPHRARPQCRGGRGHARAQGGPALHAGPL